ncbi:MAG: hypothetical protein AAF849_04910 [Bacteroidota bacterium]
MNDTVDLKEVADAAKKTMSEISEIISSLTPDDIKSKSDREELEQMLDDLKELRQMVEAKI